MKKTLKNLFVLFCATLFLHLNTGFAQNRDCLITTFPYQEGFEGNEQEFPECWTQEFVSGDAVWEVAPADFYVYTPPTTHSGDYKAAIWPLMGVTKLITPPMNLTSVFNPVLKFWHNQTAFIGQDYLKVYYKTSAAGEWNLLVSYETSITDWIEEVIPLPEKSSEYYIAFEAEGYFGYGIQLDDISVESFGNFFDGQVTGIYTPNSDEYLTATETVRATIKNNSSEPISEFELVLELDGNVVTTETYTGTIESLGEADHTFIAKLDLSEAGKEYAVSVTIIIDDDEVPENDTFTKQVKHFSSEIRLYGYRHDESVASNTTKSFVSFEPTSPNILDRTSDYMPSGDASQIFSGEYVDGYIYGYTIKRELFMYHPRHFVKIDPKTWTEVYAVPVDKFPDDISYDYSSSTMYGVSYTSDGSNLVEIDLTNGQMTDLGKSNKTFAAFACNTQGELYGVDHIDGFIYEINKQDATTTFVTSTGHLPRGVQSMAFDHNTGKLFWVVRPDDSETQLLEINVSTGEIVDRGAMGGYAQIVALYSKPKKVNIVSIEPAHDATDVPLNTPVLVTFDRNVIDINLAGITINGETAIARITDNVLNFTKIPELAYDTKYTVYIPPKAILGYDEAITWSFTTEEEEEVGIKNVDNNVVQIYPNPSNGKVNISVSESSKVKLYDVTGKTIKEFSITENSSFDVTLPYGLYLVKVESANSVSTHKLVINK